MSDDRFDQDLRAVLLEDAPGEVPDDLRRRVAAVPATHPVAGRVSGPSWRRPVTLWLGAGAALVLVLVAASWWFGPAAQQGVGGLPSSSPSTEPLVTLPPSVAVISPSASNEPSPSSGTASPSMTPAPSGPIACVAADLQARILGWGGAAGTRGTDVEITNTAAHPCFVRGTPGLQLVDSTGRVLIDSAAAGPSGEPRTEPGDKAIELAPGGRAQTTVTVSNYCGADPTLPIDIAFTLPSGGGRLVAVPGTGVSSSEARPLCMGSAAPATIAMTGWKK
jgi:hypothetical protein